MPAVTHQGDLRVGILGCAWIARKNARAIRLAKGVTVGAVASRSADKAKEFLRICELSETEVAVMGYDQLLESDKIDAVYMPLPTGLHLEWVKKAARAGKHILLEKPLSMTGQELEEMLEVCQAAGVAVLDGTMFTHHPRLEALRKEINHMGGAMEVRCSFHFQGDSTFLEGNIRTQKDLDGLGCLGDLGWYTIKLALWVFGFERPTSVMANLGQDFNSQGVLLCGGGTVTWGDKRVARMDYSFVQPVCQDVVIACKDGIIRLNDFVLPRNESYCLVKVEENLAIVGIDEKPPAATRVVGQRRTVECVTERPQESLMFETFKRLCADPRGEEAARWLAEARLTMETVLALEQSGGGGGGAPSVAGM